MTVAKNWGYDSASRFFALRIDDCVEKSACLFFSFYVASSHDACDESHICGFTRVVNGGDDLQFRICRPLDDDCWIRCKISDRDGNLVDTCGCRVVPDVSDLKSRVAHLEGVISGLRDRVDTVASAHFQLHGFIRSDVGFADLDAAIVGLVEYHQGLGWTI